MSEKKPFFAPTLEELALEPYFKEAAREAREASRRYWVRNGPADRQYPVLPTWRPKPKPDQM